MQRRAIVTYTIGELYERMAEVTHPRLKDYAARIGAQFVVISRREFPDRAVELEKLGVGNLLGLYDRILLIDTDVVVDRKSPDIFDVVPEDCFGSLDERQVWRKEIVQELWRIEAEKVGEKKRWGMPPLFRDVPYLNGGVWVVSSQHAPLLKDPDILTFTYPEQTLVSLRAWRAKTPLFFLPEVFNYMGHAHDRSFEPTKGVHFYHVTGATADRMEVLARLGREVR